jgi:hypothetical protein
MPYLGKKPEDTFRGLAFKDTFTGDGSTVAFDITNAAPAGGDFDIEVFVENVRQEPGVGKAYTLGADGSGNIKRITFSTAPESAAEIYVINPGKPFETLTIADDSVTTVKIQNNAVTAGKLATTLNLSSNTITLPSTFVTTTDTQTLTNKTISGASNTLSSIENASLTNSIIKFADDTSTVSSIPLGGTLKISGATLSGDTLTLAGGGTSWQAVKTSGFTAAGGEGYFCDTTSSAFTATLPTSPSQGDEVSFIDYAGTFDTNNLTIGRNSHKIQGVAEDLTVSIERAGFTLVYVDATQGWLLKDK